LLYHLSRIGYRIVDSRRRDAHAIAAYGLVEAVPCIAVDLAGLTVVDEDSRGGHVDVEVVVAAAGDDRSHIQPLVFAGVRPLRTVAVGPAGVRR